MANQGGRYVVIDGKRLTEAQAEKLKPKKTSTSKTAVKAKPKVTNDE